MRDYPDYLIAALRLLRPGGVVAFNNALPTGPLETELPGGTTASDSIFSDTDFDDTADIAQQVRSDERLVPVLVPLGGGLLAAVKRGD
jgi:predicted O-methyltransferase YrrM